MTSKQALLTLYKKKGETPLECLERFRKENPEYEKEKMTYAGRLDPLAEGLLIALVGEECKNKEKYLGLDKEYEVDILFGFSTDTYDVLGKVIGVSSTEDFSVQRVRDVIQSSVGKFTQKYPAFSSKTIRGKSLFSLFKRGELNDDEIPTKDVEIKSIEVLGERTIAKNDLLKNIQDSIMRVSGDFRQKEISEIWKMELEKSPLQTFHIVSIKVDCTSGTYMRSLANTIGEKVGVPALAFGIKRIKLGTYSILTE
jgi:tRNA pseudouridine(55) synthase